MTGPFKSLEWHLLNKTYVISVFMVIRLDKFGKQNCLILSFPQRNLSNCVSNVICKVFVDEALIFPLCGLWTCSYVTLLITFTCQDVILNNVKILIAVLFVQLTCQMVLCKMPISWYCLTFYGSWWSFITNRSISKNVYSLPLG